MENNDTFKMTYSSSQQEEIQAIQKKYTPPQEDKMQLLRALDAGATNKAVTVSLIFGVLGALILGIGMSLVMTDFGAVLGRLSFPLGIATGVIGIVLLALAYPLYNRTLKKQREKIAPEILRLTEELMQ